MYVYLCTSKSRASQLLFLSFPRWRLGAGNASAFLGENLTKGSFLPNFCSSVSFDFAFSLEFLVDVMFSPKKSINYSHNDINAPDQRHMEGLDLRGSKSFGRSRVIEGSGVWKVLAHLKISGGFMKFEVSSSGSGGFWRDFKGSGSIWTVWEGLSGLRFWRIPKVREGSQASFNFKWRVFGAFAVSRALEGSGRFQMLLEVSLKGPEVPEGFSSVWQVLAGSGGCRYSRCIEFMA